MDVEITIENPPQGLVPGYTFEGTINVEGEVSMMLIPQSAVTTRRGISTVEKKLSDGTSQTVTITVKYLGEGICQVLGGDLKVGDTVLVRKSVLPSDAASSMMLSVGGGNDEPPRGGGPGSR